MEFHLLQDFKTILLADIGENDTTTATKNMKLSKDILLINNTANSGWRRGKTRVCKSVDMFDTVDTVCV